MPKQKLKSKEELENEFDVGQAIENLAEGLPDFYPLPDITPLQQLVNRLYMKLRLCGMPAKEVSMTINGLLAKHGITKKDLLDIRDILNKKSK